MTATISTLSAKDTANAGDDPYFSRTIDSCETVERVDPVVSESGEVTSLAPDQLTRFARDGFLVMPSLFSASEVESLLVEAQQLANEWPENRPGLVREPGSTTVRSIFRLHKISERFRELFADRRVLSPVQRLLCDDLYIHQSRVNYKPAFNGKEFFWHSDFETWHVEDGMPRMRAISMSLFLTDSHEFNGPLMLVPGSHRTYVRCVGETPEKNFEKSLRQQEVGVPSHEALAKLVDEGGIIAPKGPAGTVILFDCNTMHASTGNLSPMPRTNVFAVYNSVENSLVEPFGSQPARPDYLAERSIEPIRPID